MSPKFRSVSLYNHAAAFSSYRPSWGKCTEGPQNDLENYNNVRYIIYVLLVPSSPKSQSVSLYQKPLSRYMYSHFKTNTPNDPKMTVNPTRSNVSHTCFTSNHESQISVPFALEPAVFEVQAILMQMHQIIPKWPRHLKDQMCPHMHYWCPRVSNFSLFCFTARCFWDTGQFETRVPQSDLEPYKVKCVTIPIFQSVSLYQKPLSRYSHFKTNAPNDPKMTLNLQGQMYPIHALLVSTSTKFQSLSLYNQPFSRYRPFSDKYTELHQNDLKPHKVKGTPYTRY